MELQKQGDELQPRLDIFLVRVSNYMYRVWSEIAISLFKKGLPLEERQAKMREEILKWATDKYPGYDIVGFEDYSNEEAVELSQKIGRPVGWGMYILFQKKGSTTAVSNQNLLEQGHLQIEF